MFAGLPATSSIGEAPPLSALGTDITKEKEQKRYRVKVTFYKKL